MAGAEKRRNVPYNENITYNADGLQLLNMVETWEDDSEHDNPLKGTQDLKTVSGLHKSMA